MTSPSSGSLTASQPPKPTVEVWVEGVIPTDAQLIDHHCQSCLHSWLSALQPNLSPIHAYEVTVRFTNDDDIQALNRDYRQKDQPTDVLAFAALEAEQPGWEEMKWEIPVYLGDIVISVETARRQCHENGHSLRQELAWLMAHGFLHLLGWDHPDDASLEQMLATQTILLNQVTWD